MTHLKRGDTNHTMRYITLNSQLDAALDFDHTGLYWAVQASRGWALWEPRWVRAYLGRRPMAGSTLRSH
jgi:hypothetical protein